MKDSDTNGAGILNYWPFKNSQPRKTQLDVFEWISNLPKEIRYIIAEVPVGGGKSPIALTASGFFGGGKGNSVILTPQKVLQKQYEDSFSMDLIHSVYGAVNYKCEPKGTNCDVGSLVKPRCTGCPHKAVTNAAVNAPNLVLNYTLGMLGFQFGTKYLQKRSIIIFDECHTLEDQLTEFRSFYISERACKKYGVLYKKPISLEEVWYFIDSIYLPAVKEYHYKLQEEYNDIIEKYELSNKAPSKDEINKIREFQEVDNYMARLIEIHGSDIDVLKETYVLTYEAASFRLKNLYADGIFAELVDPMADRFLFMSSTILDHKSFCSDLGIDINQAAFISMDSEFPKENRPVYFMPVAKMNYGWDSADRKPDRDAMLEAIKEILTNYHKTDSGVIHTGSFAIAKWLVKELSADKAFKHKIFHHNSTEDDLISRDKTISSFIESDLPSVLISPSVTEGLDLKDDLGRFSIIAKVPFLSLGDAWVKRRQELSPKWYAKKAITGIIQASGRVVRSKDDIGVTYILDTSFAMLKNMNKEMFPKWWLKSYEKI